MDHHSFALLTLLPVNLALVMIHAGTFYNVMFILQMLFYFLALSGYGLAKINKRNKLLYTPYYFLFMNFNVFLGIDYLRSHKASGKWEKAQRA